MSEPPPEHRLFARPGSVPEPPEAPEVRNPPPVVVVAAGAEVVEQGVDRDGRNDRRLWIAGAVVLVLLGGGVAAYQLLLRDPPTTTSAGLVLPEAITAEPSVAWTRDADDSVDNVTAAGDRVYVVDEDGRVLALGEDGDELWTHDEEVSYVYGMPGRDDLLLAGGGDGGGAGALAADDGAEVWWDDDIESPIWFGDGGALVDVGNLGSLDGEVAWLDTRTGRERWRTDARSAGAYDDAVYVVFDGQLRRLERDSGTEEWSVSVTVAPDGYPYVAAVDGFVAVGSGPEATAYDADSGEELWSVAGGEDSLLTVGAFADDRVHVTETVYDDEGEGAPESTVTVLDAEGQVAELDVAGTPFVFGNVLEVDGRSWFLDQSSGRLLDGDAEQVAQYDGDLALADRGLYALTGSRVRYYPYGDEEPAWEVELPDDQNQDGSLRIEPFDGGLVLVGDDGELTAYR